MGFFMDQSTEPWAFLVDDWLARQYEVNTKKQITVAKVFFFQSESHQRVEQATVVCRGGCLCQFVREKTG